MKGEKVFVVSAFLGLLVVPVRAGNLEESKASFTLVSEAGQPVTLIAPAGQDVDAAVSELSTCLKRITARDFPVVRNLEEPRNPVERAIVLQLGAGPEEEGSFELQVTKDEARISSRTAEGISFGVSELLEQLGVRWYLPGELGTVVPKTSHPKLEVQNQRQIPSFAGRYFGPTRDKIWEKRVRFGGFYFPPAHGIQLGKDGKFEKHPEYYAEVKGKRVPKQLCISNPEVLSLAVATAKAYFDKNPEKTVMGLGPNDGANFCECKDCRALDSGDWDPFSSEPVMTDRYIWFFNRMLEELDKTHPGRSLAFYAYHSYMRPPRKVVPNARILPALAPIALCRVHGMNNPICPDRSYYRYLMEEWTKLLPRVFERGYWFNLADPGFPFSSVHRMRDEIPAAKKYGLYGWRTEAFCHWAAELPSQYVAAKLMWNADTDVNALLEDFYAKFFGPAAGPMKVYLETMDHALRDGDHHSGSSFSTPQLYTEAVRERARAALDQAATLATDEPYRQRVEVVRLSFNYLEHFVAMQSARNKQSWEEAWQHLQELDAVQKALLACDPPMIHPIYSKIYVDRFFRLPVEQGYERSRNGNRVVAALSGDWDFQIDPAGVGQDIGLQRAEITGGNWQRISACETTWGDNGLHYYRGLAWYRQKVEIGKEWEGQRIFLWFGGVDETARVWVNGVEVGISADAPFTPFEFDVTAAIRAGGPNVVTVCTANNRTDELGTGGIMGPVMFYSPAGGEKAVPRNVLPLRETFP